MSIAGVLTAGTTQPSSLLPAPTTASTPEHIIAELLVLIAFTVLAVGLMVRTGAFRPSKIRGVDRLPQRGLAPALLVVLFIGMCVFAFTQLAIASAAKARWIASGRPLPANVMAMLSGSDIALISTVPFLIGLLALVGGDLMVSRELPVLLGYAPRKLARGVLIGIVAFLIIVPFVFWVNVLTEQVYRYIHFEHPMEHDLLRTFGESHVTSTRTLIVLGAIFCAPLLEELLFRGHLQTLIRHGLNWLTSLRRTSTESSPGATPEVPPPPVAAADTGGSAPPVLEYATPPLPPRPTPAAWTSWVAVILASVAFAMVHQDWMRPPIFALALGLGYVYERTGNLWTSITVHLLFNSLSTIEYVFMMQGR